jgi:heat shock protein HslJ
MKKIIIFIVVVWVGLGAWYAYDTGMIDLSHPNADSVLTAKNWQWQSTSYPNNEDLIADNPAQFTARFLADGQFSTGTDCNTAVGSYEINDNEMSIDPVAVTEIACGGETLEQSYLQDIQAVSGYYITGTNELLLYTESGASMRFSSP